ncbi:adhesin [Streptomyces agglomeratus]|uniref:adhesin n=1 Tax=Streptomyces agglomeratus TaxID=285458 RepID=UPI000A82E966|nr:adhesin [Streptomyces agglomeratus]
MVCEQCCGVRRGALPGMVCPGCGGDTGESRLASGAWIARETAAGRLSTLSRPRKALLATAVVLALAVLVTSATLLADADGGSGGGTGDPVGNADDLARGVPTRIGPTGPPEAPAAPPPGASRTPGPSSPAATSRPPAKTPRVPKNPKNPKNPPPPARHPSYTAWAGPGCSAGHYEEFGRFENGDAGWYTVDSGGFDGGSCDGRFSAVPMSGAPDKDRGNTATWSWRVGDGFEECALAVYVPKSARDVDVAGDPTFYRLLADPDDNESSYAAFAVRQTDHRGDLVSVGSHEVRGDTFAVQMIDRGRDWGDDDRVGAHHAAAQMKITCRA